jgi:hypothetical protein
MKVVFSTLWGRYKKIANRGLRLKDKTEAHLTTKLALETALEVERKSYLAFLATYGSFRDRCYFTNKVNADIFVVLTFGITDNTFIYYSMKSAPKSEKIADTITKLLDDDTKFLIGGVETRMLKPMEQRYGLVSFLLPSIPGIIIAFPFALYDGIESSLSHVSRSLANSIILSLKEFAV